jgi:hypothetical protein
MGILEPAAEKKNKIMNNLRKMQRKPAPWLNEGQRL